MKLKLFISVILIVVTHVLVAQSDNCATATVLTLDASGNVCVSGTTVNATSSLTLYGGCNPVFSNNEVWYTFVTSGPTNAFDVTPQGLSNPEIVIYTGGCGVTMETCNNSTGTGNLNTNWGIPAGTQVWIGIMSNQGNEGGFDFCVNSTTPPPGGGNGCAGAIPLCDKAVTTSIDMTPISASGIQPDCFGQSVQADVWFTFTCTQTGTLEFQATPTGAGASTVELDWSMWDITAGGCGATAGPTFACNWNYDAGNGNPSGMGPASCVACPTGAIGLFACEEFCAPAVITAGQTYVIMMDYYTGGGAGFMDFSFLPGMTAEIAPFADFSINPIGPTCATSLNVTITDNSVGVPTYDFGDGSPTYTGNNPPVHNYTTPGTYAITASIGGACPTTHTEFVQLFGPVVTVPTVVLESCPGACDGSISLATTGGSGVYTYAWSPPAGQTTPTVTGLCNGNYSVTVTDAVCGNIVEPVTINPAPACCAMDSMPIVMINCYSTPFLEYDISGTVYYTGAPTTGTLTITDCYGNPQVFTAPFGTSQAFTFIGLPQTGSNCAFTAVFSTDPTCTIITNFMAPPPITSFSLNTGFCINNTFMVNGDIGFSNPPATGTLTISVNDGTSNYDTIINAPFTSPENWSVSGIPTGGGAFTVTYYFTGFPMCTQVANGTAPANCGCVADAGTFTPSITGTSQNTNMLCFGDQFTLTSNGDFVPPDIALSPPIPAPAGYNPGLGYLIYSCPPTVMPQNPLWTPPPANTPIDPCLVGLVGFGSSFNDINFLGGPSYAGPWVNNTIYYVPITFYDTINGYYSYTNTITNCFDLGAPFAVQYLTEITTTSVEDCQDSSVTVTVTGGVPEADGSLYTASNLLPVTASFVNTTATHNGTIVINGLQNGDMYSFDIVDTNGCPVTVTGGPFLGLPNANAGVDDTTCTLTYNLNATTSFGTGTWTGTGVFSNPNSATSSVTAAAAGTFTFTWTEDNTGGCTSADNTTITFNILSIPNTPTNPTCNNGNDGQIILAPQGGVSPYTYLWNAAANNQITNPAINLGAGSFMVTVTDAFGCFQDSTFSLTEPTPFTYTTTSVSSNCGLADGSVTVVGFAGGTGGYTYDWGAGPIASNTLLNLTPGTYTVTVADNAIPVGCDTTFTITVGNNPSFTASITGFTDATCNGYNDGTATAGGSDPLVSYNFNWFNAGGQVTQTATGLVAGTYDVELTDPNTGCVDTATVTIGEPTLVTVTAVTPVNICLGQSANLTATGANGNGGAYTFNWDAGTFIGSPYVVTPIANTTYSVFAMDVDGCPSLPVNVNVIVSPGLIVTTDPDFSICAGDPATFSAYGSFGNGNSASYVYTWDDGINVIGTGATQTVSPAFTTTYTVTLDDGCTTPLATAQITITVNPLPPVVFWVDMPSVCLLPAQAFEFSTDTTGGLFSSILWNFGDANTGSLDTISHLYANSGVYDVTLTLTDTNGCSNFLTNLSYVEVYQNPIADFTMNPNPTSMFDPNIHFYDQSTPPPMFSWAWDIGGLDSSYSQNFTYTFPADTGHYLILLTVTDIHGCEDTTSNTAIVIGEFGIFVPNAFTPDGDGVNDGFFPNGFGINETDYTFFIFDRWGEVIFESHKTFEPWDGTYKGKLVQNGVYVWKLLFTDINGQEHTYIGHVSVIR